MARIRSIKPESSVSVPLSRCSDQACLLFAYLPCYCDDEGRMPYEPERVRALVVPMRDWSVKDVAYYVDELAGQGLVELYESGGRSYLFVTGFAEHQHPKKPRPSEYPPPPSLSEPVGNQGGSGGEPVGEQSRTDEGGDRAEDAPCAGGSPLVGNQGGTSGEAVPPGEGEGVGEGRGETHNPYPESTSAEPPSDVFDVRLPSDEEVMRMATYINRRCRKNIQPGDRQALDPIALRLAEGHSFEELKAIVDLKAAIWLGDPKMRQWLRPQTLFGNKFEKYLGEVAESGSHSRYADAF